MSAPPPPTPIDLGQGASLRYWEAWLPSDRAAEAEAVLRREVPWRHESIKLFGRNIPQPRLSSWHGDPEAVYTYSGLTNHPQAWTPALEELRQALETDVGVPFNSVLCNLYRGESDSMGWHSDDEPELGPEPTIASVSLGAPRRFILKHRKDTKRERLVIHLAPGSLLVMEGSTQSLWKHSVPKERAAHGERINLTFRFVHPS